MMNNKDSVLINLRHLGLSADEAKVYLALLDEPLSHLAIARKTGINRTKVYRVADSLVARGLISQESSDNGRKLAANDPANLEITLTTAEEQLKAQRALFARTLPDLQTTFQRSGKQTGDDFVVNTYEGVDGFKQMLWNELKTEKEILIFGSGRLEELVGSTRWSEKHRAKTLEAGYKIREILNPKGKAENFTKNSEFIEKVYFKRYISPAVLPLTQQLCVYNNTVSIYNWRNQQKVGTEIINKDFADMQRAMFESYWKIADLQA